jgi:tetratricopeptide (TPR) repeat protein
MPTIAERTGQTESIVEHWHALNYFCDRNAIIKAFVSCLNEDPSSEKILFLHGDGGNGKSLLLKYLREFCAKRFDKNYWGLLKAFPDEDFAKTVKDTVENIKLLPCGDLDFSATQGKIQPQNVVYALSALRSQLIKYKLRFPTFEYVIFWYLLKTNKLSAEGLQSILPTEEIDLGTEVVNYFSQKSSAGIAKAAVNLFGKYVLDRNLKAKVAQFWHKRGVSQEDIAEIESLNDENQILLSLPRFFANDLNAAILKNGAPPRVILFFDSHEAFWGDLRESSEGTQYFEKDAWLRQLLTLLDYSAGIVAIVAGRELPRWGDKNELGAFLCNPHIPEEFLECHYVGNLSPGDAEEVLRKANIKGDSLRQALIAYTEVEKNEIHPLYLGLAADMVLAAERQDILLTPADFQQLPLRADKERVLIDRFLKYIDDDLRNAIYALSAARNFNREIFVKLGQPEHLNFNSTASTFNHLTRLSFVYPSKKGEIGLYRIHQLLRRLFAAHNPKKQNEAHEILWQYYRQLSEEHGSLLPVAESLYHVNKLDWMAGCGNWLKLFATQLEYKFYDVCRAFLEISKELDIKSDLVLGHVLLSEAQFYLEFGIFDLARKKSEESIVAFTRFFLDNSDSFAALNDMAVAYTLLGRIQEQLCQYTEAQLAHQQADVYLKKALILEPLNADCLTNYATNIGHLGNLQIGLKKYHQAVNNFNNAIKLFRNVLKNASSHIAARNNLAIVLRDLADVQAQISNKKILAKSLIYKNPEDISINFEVPISNYRKAIAHCDVLIAANSLDLVARSNKAQTLDHLARLLLRLGNDGEAQMYYDQASYELNFILSKTPDNISAYTDAAELMRFYGGWQVTSEYKMEGCGNLLSGLKIVESGLNIVPDFPTLIELKRQIEDLIEEHCC